MVCPGPSILAKCPKLSPRTDKGWGILEVVTDNHVLISWCHVGGYELESVTHGPVNTHGPYLAPILAMEKWTLLRPMFIYYYTYISYISHCMWDYVSQLISFILPLHTLLLFLILFSKPPYPVYIPISNN